MTDTEQLFLVAGIWCLLSAFIVRFIPKRSGRIAAFALLVGIPFWELPYGYFNFRTLCAEALDMRVTEKITPQDSICLEYFDAGLYSALARAGFSRIEIVNRSDNARKYLDKGLLNFVDRREAKSTYCLTFANDQPMPWRILRSDTLIQDGTSKKIVGKSSSIYWIGMWWQEQARPLLGRGGICSKDLDNAIRAVRQGSG